MIFTNSFSGLIVRGNMSQLCQRRVVSHSLDLVRARANRIFFLLLSQSYNVIERKSKEMYLLYNTSHNPLSFLATQ